MHGQIVIPKLEALLPAPMFRAYTAASSEADLKVERASGAYLDLLSFSITNNLTGLDDLPPQRALDYLKSQYSTHIAPLVQSFRGQTGRAFAEKMFICAIEAEDTSVVEMILRHSQNTKVDANKSVCKYDGNRYTPIERSAGLRDIRTTRVLLKYGADPNKTLVKEKPPMAHSSDWRVGALSCSLDWNTGEKTPVEFELVQLLLEHGAYVQTRHLDAALRQQRSEVLHVLLEAGACVNHEEWGISGLFGRAIEVLNDEAAIQSINMLKQIGADINAPQSRARPTMLDMAAKRGSFDLVLMLLHSGAVETETTLSYAIQGQNRTIVDLFLNGKQADSLSCCIPRTTPYAEAIRMGDEALMHILEQKGSLSNIKEMPRFIAALNAASEVGNTEVIRRLLKTSPKPSKGYPLSTVLNDALTTAVGLNQERIAIMRIHAGADGNVDSYSMPTPLRKALENRNAEIVRALLNFIPTSIADVEESSPLLAAVEWGDTSIIEDLLVSGCDIESASFEGETPLTVTIRKHDRQLLDYFLNAGSNVNQTHRCGKLGSGEFRTALSTAVEVQDIGLVNYLLSVGADPGDSFSLLKSCERGGDVLRSVLDTFLKKYPDGKPGYCDLALATAVQRNDASMLERLKPVMALKFPGYSQHVGKLIGRNLIACNQVSVEAVRILLDSGANPDAVTWLGRWTERIPLLSAAINVKNIQMVQLLLDKGADVNFPATRGIKFTPIQAAAKTGCYEIVLMLINRGANVDALAADAGGGTAIQLSAIGGFLGIAELLLKKGAKINRAPSILHGRTALEGAAEWGRLDMVQFLLNCGAEIDGPSRESFLNAMKLAEENGHFVVLELLQSYLQ